MRVRKNVWTLPDGDQTLAWYGKAVAAMLDRPIADPRSWRYQAAIHGYEPGNDPLATSGDRLPDDQETYWQQCQHASSFFLPWHRMYLLHFERIVAAQVAALGGPADWALPYWDYSGSPAWSLLPAAFRDGALFVGQRNANANAGRPFLERQDVDLRGALFARGTTDTGGFFGPPPANHSGGSAPFGALENAPHNAIHVQVGSDAGQGDPDGGWMLNPDLAALDPIFWLHHANIDRLWEVWRRRDAAHADLASAYWRSGVAFAFHDATGAPVTMKTSDVLDTTALDYAYEDTSDPLAAAPSARGAMAAVTQHELVGATIGSVDLGEATAHVQVPTPVTPQSFAAARAQPVQHVTLRLENVTSSHAAPMYDVYLNVPAGDDPAQHEDHFVGRAAMFGIAKASKPGGPHGGGGVSFAFDITELYGRLASAGKVDPAHLVVSFVPKRAKDTAKVKVGRISLYFG